MKFTLLALTCLHQSTIINSLNQKLLKKVDNTTSDQLVEATHFIIENFFLRIYSTYNIITAVEVQREPSFVDFKDALLRLNNGFFIHRLDIHTHIRKIAFRPKIYNVILLDNFKSFEVFLSKMDPTLFNYGGFFLFVLVKGKIKEINEIFRLMWRENIENVNIIYDGEFGVEMLTFFPFNNKSCGDTSAVFWTGFSQHKFSKPDIELFPYKFQDLYGCEIRLVTFHRCPAVCVEVEDNQVTATGFDIGIVDIIAESMNMKLKKEILMGPEQWGTVLRNGTTTGAISRIVNNQSDIAIGNFLLRSSRLKIMDSSFVYFSFPVVFAIPPGERLTAFEKLLRPFEFAVWMALVASLAIGMLVILFINVGAKHLRDFVYGTRIRHAVVNMMEVIFGQSQRRLPKRNFSRYLLMMFLLFCLVKRSIYQGRLFIFLQSDGRHKEVQTIDEMAAKDFDFYMFESYTDIIESQPKIYNK
jgi:hypothetical protein